MKSKKFVSLLVTLIFGSFWMVSTQDPPNASSNNDQKITTQKIQESQKKQDTTTSNRAFLSNFFAKLHQIGKDASVGAACGILVSLKNGEDLFHNAVHNGTIALLTSLIYHLLQDHGPNLPGWLKAFNAQLVATTSYSLAVSRPLDPKSILLSSVNTAAYVHGNEIYHHHGESFRKSIATIWNNLKKRALLRKNI